MTRRSERVGELVREEVARVLREDVADPRLSLVTLTRVDVSPEFSNALVFWSVMQTKQGPEVLEVQQTLDRAAAFVRGRLAKSLSLRRIPQLRFRHDPSLELGSKTLAVLQEIADEEKP